MVLLFLLCFLFRFTLGKSDVSCVESPADIGFLVDGSGSVGPYNFRTTVSFVIDFIKYFQISDTFTKISLFQFNGQVENGFHFYQYTTSTLVENAINSIVYRGGSTSFEIPLIFAKEQMFQQSNGARNDAKKILVFITDGQAGLSAIPGNALRDMNITVYVVAVGNVEYGVYNPTLQLIATNSSYIYTVNNYTMIWSIKNSLTSKTCKEIIEHVKEVHPCTKNKDLCQNGGTCQITGTSSYKCYCVTGYTGNNCETDIDDCQNVTCHNNGTCIDHVGSFTCLCQEPFTGIYCETNWCEPLPADVVFLIDESASIDKTSLLYAYEHIETTLNKWVIDSSHFQIAFVSFSKSAKIILHFSDVTTKSTLLQAVENMTSLQQSSEIDKGLSTAKDMLLYRGRPDAKKIIIMYSDGFPSSPQRLQYVVNSLYSIEVYAIAIGSDVSHYFLSSICGVMSRVFPHHSDSLWHRMMKDLIIPECNACTDSQESDLVIMVDTTSTIAENLQQVVPSILLKIISKLNFDANTTQLALMTYDKKATLRFGFDVYSERNRMDLQRTLSSYDKSPITEVNITRAVMDALDLLYNSSLGARSAAKKVILIISEFRSTTPEIHELQDMRNTLIDVNTIGLIDDEHSFEAMAEVATSPLHIGTIGRFKTNQIDLFIDSFVEQLKTIQCRLIS